MEGLAPFGGRPIGQEDEVLVGRRRGYLTESGEGLPNSDRDGSVLGHQADWGLPVGIFVVHRRDDLSEAELIVCEPIAP